MIDFERAAIGAAHKKFPDAKITGCYFHYKMASCV